MKKLDVILKETLYLRKEGFDKFDTKILLKIPKDQRTPEIINEILIRNKTLAYSEAIKFWKRYKHLLGSVLDIDDLESVAMIGLSTGISRFDCRYNNEFSTYALHWIRQSIYREIQNNLGLARIPIHFQEKMRRVNNLYDNEMITQTMEGNVQYMFISTPSLDAHLNNDEGSLIDILQSNDIFIHPRIPMYNSPEMVFLYSELQQRIEKSLDVLKYRRQKEIVSMRLGINKYHEIFTLEAVGEKFGITRERVRQITKKYLEKIHARQCFEYSDFLIFGENND